MATDSDRARVAACVHGLDAVLDQGDGSWKAICECGWECWNQRTEQVAIDSHNLHAEFEGDV